MKARFYSMTWAALIATWSGSLLAATLEVPPILARKTAVSIVGDEFYINGEPTYKGRTWNGLNIQGLLLNARLVQGLFDDRNPQTVQRWAYPDTGRWDPERNTSEFIAALSQWRQHGLLAFTLNLQGGAPERQPPSQPWHHSAFEADGSLRADYLSRLERILDRADDLGMVVILGYFYFGQDERFHDEAAVIRAVDNATQWLFSRHYRHVLIEINNECNVRYDHAILQPERVHELIERVRGATQSGRRFYVGTSYGGGTVPQPNVARASDFLLLHGNGVSDPDRLAELVRKTRAVPSIFPKPILINEDDHFDFDKPKNNFLAALSERASWGFFDPGANNYQDGYQSPPVRWSINTERKYAFFKLLSEITDSPAPPMPVFPVAAAPGLPAVPPPVPSPVPGSPPPPFAATPPPPPPVAAAPVVEPPAPAPTTSTLPIPVPTSPVTPMPATPTIPASPESATFAPTTPLPVASALALPIPVPSTPVAPSPAPQPSPTLAPPPTPVSATPQPVVSAPAIPISVPPVPVVSDAASPRSVGTITISQISYRGWPGSLLMNNGVVQVVIVPAVGRVMQFGFVGEEGVFWENSSLFGQAPIWDTPEWMNFGGDKTWPAPEADWSKYTQRTWRPPPAFDAMAVEVRRDGNDLWLVSPVDRFYGIRVLRRVRLEPGQPVMTILTLYEKVAGAPVSAGVWVVTQLKDPVGLYAPMPPEKRGSPGYALLTKKAPPDLKVKKGLLSLRRSPKQPHKIGLPVGTLLWLGRNHGLRIDSPRTPFGQYPDQDSSAEIYTNPDPLQYIELETLGPVSVMKVGDRIDRSNTYTLLRRSMKDPEDEARRLLQR